MIGWMIRAIFVCAALMIAAPAYASCPDHDLVAKVDFQIADCLFGTPGGNVTHRYAFVAAGYGNCCTGGVADPVTITSPGWTALFNGFTGNQTEAFNAYMTLPGPTSPPVTFQCRQSNSGAAVASASCTVSAAVPAGQGVVVLVVAGHASGCTNLSVTDSAGNVYLPTNPTSGSAACIFYAGSLTTALTTASVVTATWGTSQYTLIEVLSVAKPIGLAWESEGSQSILPGDVLCQAPGAIFTALGYVGTSGFSGWGCTIAMFQ